MTPDEIIAELLNLSKAQWDVARLTFTPQNCGLMIRRTDIWLKAEAWLKERREERKR